MVVVISYVNLVIRDDIVVGLCLNNIVFFSIVSLVSGGIIIFMCGKVCLIICCKMGDFENFFIMMILFVLEILCFFNKFVM